MEGQISLFEFRPDLFRPPAWPKCMRSCKHFDSHPEYPPESWVIGTEWDKRCTYHRHEYGSRGGEMEGVTDENGILSLYCKYYDPKEVEE